MTMGRRSPALAIVALTAMVGFMPAHGAGGDRELGAYLSTECVTCHQITGRHTGGIPPIVGLPEDAFIALMESYRRRERDNQVMFAMAARLTPEEVAALAAYFGHLRPHD